MSVANASFTVCTARSTCSLTLAQVVEGLLELRIPRSNPLLDGYSGRIVFFLGTVIPKKKARIESLGHCNS